jgi:ribokinase
MTSLPAASPRIFVVANFVMACCWRVSRLPQPGETFVASALSMEPGGKDLNVAIGTHRLGAQVDVMLGIGDDGAGQQLLDLLAAEGLGANYVNKLGAQSGYGAGMIADNGQNAIAVFPGPNLLLTAAHVDQAESAIAAAALVYGQFETSVPAVQRAFELARRHGVRTVLNPSPWQAIPAPLLAACDVIVANEVEAAHLLGLAEPLAGHTAAQVGAMLVPRVNGFWANHSDLWVCPPLLIVTLGAHGCVAFEPGRQPLAIDAYPVETLDTMGAGDAFASALCMALCTGLDLETALTKANAAGAWLASHHGVLDALPTLAELDSFSALPQASRRIL